MRSALKMTTAITMQERLASNAVSHRVSMLHPYNARQHNSTRARQHKAAL